MWKPIRSPKMGQMSFMLIRRGLASSSVQRTLHLQEQTSSDSKKMTVVHLCSDPTGIQWSLRQFFLKYCRFQHWPWQDTWIISGWDEQNCWGPVLVSQQAHHWAVRFKMCLLWDNLSPAPITLLLGSGWVMGGRSCALLKSDIRFECLRATNTAFLFSWQIAVYTLMLRNLGVLAH